jgi:hypothetical protein
LDHFLTNDAQIQALGNLACARNLRISGFNNSITLPVNLSQLTTVTEAFLIEGQIPGILLGSLTQHSGFAQGNGTTFRDVTLSTIDLSAVRTGGGIGIGNALNLQSIVIGGSIDFQAVLGTSPISIVNVPSLTSLTIGGGSISGSLTIEATGLTNLDGIPCGFRVGRDVFIAHNPNLSTAVAQAKANCLIVTGTVTLLGNKLP